MLKKLYRGILSSLFLTVISLLLAVLLVVTLARPNYLKKWLSNSGIYSTAVDGVVAQSQQSQAEQTQANGQSEDGGPSLNDPAIQTAAKKSLNPTLIQSSVENIIGGSFNWLDGKVAKPDFRIDLTEAKNNFASNVGEAARTRYLSMPVCPPRTLPTSTDPFKINCQPKAGFDINVEVAKFVEKMQTSKDFLPDTVITADTLWADKNDGSQSFFEKNKAVPGYYRLAKSLPLILVVVSLVLATLLVLSANDKLLGIRSIGITLLVWGLIYGVSLLAGSYLVAKQSSKLAEKQTDSAFLTTTKSSFETLVKDMNHDFTKIGIEITGAYVLLGGGLIIGSSVLRKRRGGGKDAPVEHEPKAEKESPEKA